MSPSLGALAWAGTLIITLYTISVCLKRRTYLPLPPGPKRLPLIGNLLDLPKSCEWLKYAEWGRQLGSDIISLDVLGTPIIVLNSAKAAHELFENRSLIYNDRPRFPMLNELIGFHWHFAFMPYAEAWKDRRKMFSQQFTPSTVLRYRPAELLATRALLKHLLERPDDFIGHLRNMAGSIILSAAYGITIQPKDDPFIEAAEIASQAMASAGNAGAYVVDSWPVLKYIPDWFPGAGFKGKAKVWRKYVMAMIDNPFDYVKKSMANGTAESSITSRLLENFHEDANDDSKRAEREIAASETAAAMYTAASDTTVSALTTFILAMLQNRSVQVIAQKHIDELLNGERLPNFDDIANLPYVVATMKEVLRWRPVAPLAVPHSLMVDDEYRGYHLPTGAVVVGNSWAMLHDPIDYPSPDIFNPSRFLTTSGKLDPKVKEPNPAFGYGRRFCPGRELAFDSMLITIASILATFDILPVVDESGVEAAVSGEYSSGLLCHPKPFQCIIRARNKGMEKLIHDEFL